MGTLNYTTKISIGQSVAEIQDMLMRAGATAIMVRVADKQPVGISFSIVTTHGERAFTMPVDVTAMHKVLAEQRPSGGMSLAAFRSPEHAARVAWRIVKDWLAAQLALIEVDMAKLDQVMLPYLNVGNDETLYEAYRRSERAIEPPRE